MGLNVDITKMLNITTTSRCPRCKADIVNRFHDYDIETNPVVGKGHWKLNVFCSNCDFEFVEEYRVLARKSN